MRHALSWFLERTGMAAGAIGLCLVALAMIVRRQREVKRYEVAGVTLVETPKPVAELPRERILVSPDEWHQGLVLHAAFHQFAMDEARA